MRGTTTLVLVLVAVFGPAVAASPDMIAGSGDVIAVDPHMRLTPISGNPSFHYSEARDDWTVRGGILLASPVVFSDHTSHRMTLEKSGDVISKSKLQLSIRFEDGAGMAFGEASENWTLHVPDALQKERGIASIGPAEAKQLARLQAAKSESAGSLSWTITQASSDDMDSEVQSASFTDVLFRNDRKGDLVLAVATEADAEIHVPPVVASVTPSLVSSLRDAKTGVIDWDKLDSVGAPKGSVTYPSSTDIVISQLEGGAFIAKGRIEFLLLGGRGMLCRNFGEGAKVRIDGILETALRLLDTHGQITRATSGAYVLLNGEWSNAK